MRYYMKKSGIKWVLINLELVGLFIRESVF